MTPLKVRVDAQGAVPDDLRSELAGILRAEEPVAVFCGTVVDKAAFYGLLHRLRRAGLTIQDVDVHPDDAATTGRGGDGAGNGTSVATFWLDGLVGDVVSGVLSGADVAQQASSTTLRVGLRRADEVFDVLDRLESLNLDIGHLHVRPDARSAKPR